MGTDKEFLHRRLPLERLRAIVARFDAHPGDTGLELRDAVDPSGLPGVEVAVVDTGYTGGPPGTVKCTECGYSEPWAVHKCANCGHVMHD